MTTVFFALSILFGDGGVDNIQYTRVINVTSESVGQSICWSRSINTHTKSPVPQNLVFPIPLVSYVLISPPPPPLHGVCVCLCEAFTLYLHFRTRSAYKKSYNFRIIIIMENSLCSDFSVKKRKRKKNRLICLFFKSFLVGRLEIVYYFGFLVFAFVILSRRIR